MIRMPVILRTLVCLMCCALLFQCKKSTNGKAQEELAKLKNDSIMAATKARFENYCSGCHGQQMKAFVDRKWRHGKAIPDIMSSIKTGYADAGMPSFGEVFSEEEIKNLATYIRKGIDEVEKYGLQAETVKVQDTFQTESFDIVLDTVFSGINVPWHINWLPNGNMLITDRDGFLYRLDENRKKYNITGVPKVRKKDQDGLFEIQLHPNFEKNNWVYLSYSDLKVEGKDSLTTTVISRFVLKNDQLTQKKELLKALPYTSKKVHFGGKMVFDDQNRLFVTFGDRGERDVNPQDLSKIPGKIHRINDDGTIPADNPFVNEEGAKKSIYSYGHRNPQGLAFHPITNDLWEHEHGPRGGDEINIIKPGNNYGWPVISYGINYNGTTFTELLEKEGMEQPLHYWTPSIAPCGMTFVTTDKYGDWTNNLLVGSLRYGYLNRCIIENNKVVKEEILLKNLGRLRDVEVGPDGYIYVAVEKPGFVFRLVPVIP